MPGMAVQCMVNAMCRQDECSHDLCNHDVCSYDVCDQGSSILLVVVQHNKGYFNYKIA